MIQAPSNEVQQPARGDNAKSRKRKADDDMAAIEGQTSLSDDLKDQARREYQTLRLSTNKHTIDDGIWLEVLEELGHKQKDSDTYTSFKHIPLHKMESKERRYERQGWAREIEDEIGSEHKYYLCIPLRFRNPHFMPQSILDCSTTALKAIAAGLKRPPKTDNGSGALPANAPAEAAPQTQPEVIDLRTPPTQQSTLVSLRIEATQAPKKQEAALPALGLGKRASKDKDKRLSPKSAKLKWEREEKMLEAKQAELKEEMHQHKKQKPN